ncbi:hypothetical protein LUZ63_001335 [Rhynchospora breviuscula]|uniref:Nuclear pore complex protein NUP133 n=1 Tax=Rhynchospora breviuscula TaxID=2022672 RepID=A0A9Q0CWN0_9POAL|nr:hypothetical protein LUZ63_001335 [Rhynchospora breviuscula]
MFSPATRNLRRKSLKPPSDAKGLERDAPATPLHSFSSPSKRPATGTPAPWTSRFPIPSSRSPALKPTEKADVADHTQPVFVAQFPQAVRNAQANLLQKNLTAVYEKRAFAGGIDKGMSLAWMICGSELFIWSYSSPSVDKGCFALDIPSSLVGNDGMIHWAICMVRWENTRSPSKTEIEAVFGKSPSVGIILCNLTTRGIVYWSDIYTERRRDPIVDLPNGADEDSNIQHSDTFSSIIAAPTSGNHRECIGIACQSNGVLWSFQFNPDVIHRRKISESLPGNGCHAKSLVWQPRRNSSDLSFFCLTNSEVQCWNVVLSPRLIVKNLWTHIVVGDDDDLGIKKDIAGQKQVWLLDLQVDERGRELSILVATFCKDRASSSNYTQYSLLTMLYNKAPNTVPEQRGPRKERVLEKKAPLQVIIPKAQVEDEVFLSSMKLRVGGKPSGSVIILSGDGTATVAHYWRGSMRLYQFDLPWDAGKVLDASILPLAEEAEVENEGGAWVVLTEKAGIWAIPEKSVLVGGVQPPERSLSRKGSSNEGIREEEKRIQAFGIGSVAPRRVSSEAWRAGSSENRQRTSFSGVPQRGANDEEAEALLFRSFHDFVLSGRIEEGLLEKLRDKGAFDKEGETNVFARTSRSIVDTLAKHWTTNRGAEIVASTVVSSLLVDKQQKHHNFLQFLALSKSHDELALKQRNSMLSIMEHGEKLSSLIHLRELQSILLSQQEKKPSHTGSLWKLIQLVGERARRNNVILMDRDNVEVFYSKISELEEFFSCLSHYLDHIITPDNGEQPQSPLRIQMDHAFELSSACITLIQSALQYRHDQKDWYPSLEGLTPWNSLPVVRSGLWAIASSLTELSKEAAGLDDMSVKEELLSLVQGLTDALLEAYAGSITAKIERGEDSQGLSLEYRARRDQLLRSLYQLAKVFAESKYQELSKDAEDLELRGSIFREVNSAVLLTAMRHGGYQTLWDLCYDLSDAVLLRNLMHECVGLSRFAFEQLIKRGEYGKLLRLGEEFPEDLAHFLKETERNDLSWLHHIYLKDFPSACKTLHALALSSTLPQTKRKSSLQSLSQRKRFLYLSKIAALAGQDEGFELKIASIEADLRIIKLQEEIVGDDDINEGQESLGALELIRRCLTEEGRRRRDLSLKAFEVFAWMSSSLRESNRTLLEECWLNAADQDNWPAIYQASISEGWTDELLLGSLQETVLYKASSRCYGPNAQVFEGSFEDVLPLRGEEGSSSPSVEQVLSQHRYFPDAGKLMLTAVIMVKESTHYAAQDEAVAMDA